MMRFTTTMVVVSTLFFSNLLLQGRSAGPIEWIRSPSGGGLRSGVGSLLSGGLLSSRGGPRPPPPPPHPEVSHQPLMMNRTNIRSSLRSRLPFRSSDNSAAAAGVSPLPPVITVGTPLAGMQQKSQPKTLLSPVSGANQGGGRIVSLDGGGLAAAILGVNDVEGKSITNSPIDVNQVGVTLGSDVKETNFVNTFINTRSSDRGIPGYAGVGPIGIKVVL